MGNASPTIDTRQGAGVCSGENQDGNGGVPNNVKFRFGLRELLAFVTAVGVILGIAGTSVEGLFLAGQAIGLASVAILCLRAENWLLLREFDRGYFVVGAGVAMIQTINGYVFGYFGANLLALVLNLALMLFASIGILFGLFVLCFWLVTTTYFRPGAVFRGWTWLASMIALIPYTFFAATPCGYVDRAGLFTVRPLVEACDDLVVKYPLRTIIDDVHVPHDSLPPAIRRLGPSSVFVLHDGVRIERGGGFFHYGYRYSVDSTARTYELSWYAEDSEGGIIDAGKRP